MQEELRAGEEIARCPSCSLYITVVYDPVSSRLTKRHVHACWVCRRGRDRVHEGGTRVWQVVWDTQPSV